eukprot:3237247-Alexandrium_andersonii.AAC.1
MALFCTSSASHVSACAQHRSWQSSCQNMRHIGQQEATLASAPCCSGWSCKLSPLPQIWHTPS